MEDDILLRTIVKTLTPFIFMFGLYVQFHGDYSPGGGFQAGVICAAAFISHALINGLNDINKIISEKTAIAIACFGVLLYGGTGIVSMNNCGTYLNYSVLTRSSCEEHVTREQKVEDLVEASKDSNKVAPLTKVIKRRNQENLSGDYSEKNVNFKEVEIHSLHGQHIGILVIEAGVGLTVFSVMMLLFFVFAKRGS